ncbi:MAG: 30S ribosomal protein S16 [Candidatus Woesebacteria bacterium GW2011_GWB1_45_5]|uniref:Small ribosomal subunit protein bS16 n=1 Tax=Candidatus Woesebacteria bacterium GW2011_GWB1_45_5 TaxID=1618581 RepID=A0A0G1QK30_9BACT|nr:MAG: 30S ribosomal protein S16 [Candidatus Woesebacteria bacterium GW2011_GWB1_45_5]
MVKIKLSRYGRKKAPFYRIVAVDSIKKRDGAVLEVLGYYNPAKKTLKVEKDKIKSWTQKGAQITTGVAKLLK